MIGGSCKICACAIGPRNTSGLCRPCYREMQYASLPRGECSNCGTALGPTNTSGLCAPCLNRARAQDPAFQAKRIAGVRRKFKDPVYMERSRQRASRMGKKAAADPAIREKRVAFGKWVYANVLSRPDIREKTLAAVREKSGAACRAKRLAWCPPEFRDEYQQLYKSKRMTSAEARAFVLAKAAEAKRSMTFEEKLKLVAEGKLSIVNTIRPASNDHEFTLGGVSSGWAA